MKTKIAASLLSFLILAAGTIASAGTTTCHERGMRWTYSQFSSDGGAQPLPGMQDPHWYLNGEEVLENAPAWEGEFQVVGERVNEPNQKILRAFTREMKVQDQTFTMFCFVDIYTGPPRP